MGGSSRASRASRTDGVVANSSLSFTMARRLLVRVVQLDQLLIGAKNELR